MHHLVEPAEPAAAVGAAVVAVVVEVAVGLLDLTVDLLAWLVCDVPVGLSCRVDHVQLEDAGVVVVAVAVRPALTAWDPLCLKKKVKDFER